MSTPTRKQLIPLIVLVALVAAGCRPGPSTTPVKITRSNVIVVGDSITFQAQWDGDLIGAALRSEGVSRNAIDGRPGRRLADDDWLTNLGPAGVTVLALGANDVLYAVDHVAEANWPSYFQSVLSDRTVRAQLAGSQCVLLQRPDGRSWWMLGGGDAARQAKFQRAASEMYAQQQVVDGRRGVAVSWWTPPTDGTTDGLHLTPASERAWTAWLAEDVRWLKDRGC